MPIPLVLFGAWLLEAPANIVILLRDGQLCFYCTSISASAIRDLLSVQQLNALEANFFIAGMILCIILSTFAYGVTTLVSQSSEGTNLSSSKSKSSSTDTRLALTSVFVTVATTIIVLSTRKSFELL
ncbi:MAG: hypothetical protein AAF152_00600 [Cyanobacteria bacterium P01_A01_bin.114]